MSQVGEIRRITDVLKAKVGLIGDRPAHIFRDSVLTFAEWDRQADEVAGGLAAAGLRAGDRLFIAISMEHPFAITIASVAAMRVGAIACPVNMKLSRSELREYSNLLEPRFTITDQPEQISDIKVERSWTVDKMPRDISRVPDQSAFDPLCDAAILGTSGTTGRPKGVVLSHQDFMNRDPDPMQIPRRTAATIHSLPFTGYGGFIGQCLRPIWDSGVSVTNYPFDVDNLLRLIRQHRPVALHLVPTMFRLLLDHPDVERADMSSIRLIVSGSAPLAHDTIVRSMKLWPHIRIHNPYAMSEGGFATSAVAPEQLAKAGCVGAMQPNMEIRDENGKTAEQGVVGEIYGKASGKPRRYWNDSESSGTAWVDGWTRSGDLGYVDADGDLILTGRAKELIIRGGYNIAPIEIEDVLHANSAVKDAAVVGVAHDVLGEDVAAAVSLQRGAHITPEELVEWCRERLASNKVPRTIVILDALPVNQNAKILKRELQPIVEKAAQEDRARRRAREPSGVATG